MPGILNKRILRPSPEELSKRWHFLPLPGPGQRKAGGEAQPDVPGTEIQETTPTLESLLRLLLKQDVIPVVAPPSRVCLPPAAQGWRSSSWQMYV